VRDDPNERMRVKARGIAIALCNPKLVLPQDRRNGMMEFMAEFLHKPVQDITPEDLADACLTTSRVHPTVEQTHGYLVVQELMVWLNCQ